MGVAIVFMVAGGWTILEGVPMLGEWMVENDQRIVQEEQLAQEAELDRIVRESGNLIITVQTMAEVQAEENAMLLKIGERQRVVIKNELH